MYIFNHCSENFVKENGLHFENQAGYPDCKIVYYDMNDMIDIANSYQKLCKYSNKYHLSK
jgi:hypothetical protein